MKIIRPGHNGMVYALIESEEKVIVDTQSALDLLMSANYEAVG